MLDNNTALTFAENDGAPIDNGQASDNNTALTFVEGGSSVAVDYVDGSNSFNVVNNIYSDEGVQQSTLVQVYSDISNVLSVTNNLYQDGLNALSVTNKMYQDGLNALSTSNIIYQDGSNASSITNVIYSDTNISYDVSVEYFSDGMVGSATYPLLVAMYQDNVQSNDVGMLYYQVGNGSFALTQEIYQSTSTLVDIRPVIYSDGSVNANTIQRMYQDNVQSNDIGIKYYKDENGSFSLSQEIYKTESSIADARLTLYSDGSVAINTNQRLYQDTLTDFDMSLITYTVDMSIIDIEELKAIVRLYETLKGGLDVTAENQNFTMYQGDTKYIDFPLENTNLLGSTAIWVLKKRVSDIENIALKTTASGITMEDSIIRVKVEPIDTKAIKGMYYQELELTDSLGNVSTVATGYITIKPSGI